MSGIEKFGRSHVCNDICKLLKLREIQPRGDMLGALQGVGGVFRHGKGPRRQMQRHSGQQPAHTHAHAQM